MVDWEYEVMFMYESVNVSTVVYVNDDYVGDGGHYETVESKAVMWAQTKVEEQTGLDVVLGDLVGLEVKLTGQIGG